MKSFYRIGLILVSALLLVLSLLVAKWGESWASIGLVYVLRCGLPLVTVSIIVSLGFGLLSKQRVAVTHSQSPPLPRGRYTALDVSALVICVLAWLIFVHALGSWFGHGHTQ
jgi:hypothetical protein